MVPNNAHFSIQEGSNGFTQLALQTNKLPASFQSLLRSVATVRGVLRLSSPAWIVINAENVVPEISNADFIVAEALLPSNCLPNMITFAPLRSMAPRNDSKHAQKSSPDHYNYNCYSSCDERGHGECYGCCEIVSTVTWGRNCPGSIAASNADGVLRLHWRFSKSTQHAQALVGHESGREC